MGDGQIFPKISAPVPLTKASRLVARFQPDPSRWTLPISSQFIKREIRRRPVLYVSLTLCAPGFRVLQVNIFPIKLAERKILESGSQSGSSSLLQHYIQIERQQGNSSV
jgi:hypothetical protein